MTTLVKVVAWSIGAAYLVYGTAVVGALGIAGLWEGFAHARFMARFAGIAVYVYGTAALAFWVGARPRWLSGAVLLLLLVPGAVALVRSDGESRHLRQTARIAVTAPDEAARADARKELLALGRRSGRQPHVDELLSLLRGARDDQHRLRTVELLGALSYQRAPVLDELRGLERETRGDPARASLHEATVTAIHGINPYEPTPEGGAERP